MTFHHLLLQLKVVYGQWSRRINWCEGQYLVLSHDNDCLLKSSFVVWL